MNIDEVRDSGERERIRSAIQYVRANRCGIGAVQAIDCPDADAVNIAAMTSKGEWCCQVERHTFDTSLNSSIADLLSWAE